MNKLILTVATGVMTIGLAGYANAETNLIVNKDTGAKVYLDSDKNVTAKRNSAPEYNGYKSAQVSTDTRISADADIDGAEDASGGVLVKNDVDTDSDIDTDTDIDARLDKDFEDERDDLEDEIEESRAEAGSRIQDIGGRLDTGVKATANTKIDIR